MAKENYEVSATLTVDDETRTFHSVKELDDYVSETIDNMMHFLDMTGDVREELKRKEEKTDIYDSFMNKYLHKDVCDKEEEEDDEDDEEGDEFEEKLEEMNDKLIDILEELKNIVGK